MSDLESRLRSSSCEKSPNSCVGAVFGAASSSFTARSAENPAITIPAAISPAQPERSRRRIINGAVHTPIIVKRIRFRRVVESPRRTSGPYPATAPENAATRTITTYSIATMIGGSQRSCWSDGGVIQVLRTTYRSGHAMKALIKPARTEYVSARRDRTQNGTSETGFTTRGSLLLAPRGLFRRDTMREHQLVADT